MNTFCIITNLDKDKDLQTTKLIKDYLEERGKVVFLPEEVAKLLGCTNVFEENNSNDIQCAIILGGDGTIIQSARQLAIKGIPIVGVNLGTLGFLAEIEKKDALRNIDNLINGKYSIEQRMMIHAEISSDNIITTAGIALNDIVVTRSGLSKIIELQIYVNNDLLDIYQADGIIISTPTGSTAYNLSAGGPIIVPTSEMMVITPICPHSLNSRSIVVSGNDEVCIKVGRIRKVMNEDVVLTLDGQVGYVLQQGDTIIIKKATAVTKLLKVRDVSFYKLLRQKIGFQEKE